MKKAIIRLFLALFVLGGAYGAYKYFERLPQKQAPVATAKSPARRCHRQGLFPR